MKGLEDVKIAVNAAAATAGTSDVTGAAIDMADFEGVIITTSITTDAADNYLKLTHCDTSGGDYEDVLGSKLEAAAGADLLVMDVKKPLKRYLKPVIVRGTSTATTAIVAQKYGARKLPQTTADTAVQVKQLVEAISGTA